MKSCSECRANFEPTNNRQLACSACKTAREVRIKRERRHSHPELMERQRAATAKYRERNRDDSWRISYCLMCNNKFERKTTKKKHCSNTCRDNHRYKTDSSYRDQCKLSAQKWSRSNPDRVLANRRAYYKANWCKFQERNAAKRDRTLPADFVDTIMKDDDYTCQYCGQRGGKLTIDHKDPVSRGGSDDRSNLCVACHRCNCRKGAKTVTEFMEYLQSC